MKNLYNKIKIDIEKKHQEINQAKSDLISHSEHYFLYIHHLIYGRNPSFYHKLIESGFIRSWFEEFSEYWTSSLKGRPIRFYDFFYLYSFFRTEFQSVKVNRKTTKNQFLHAWQKPENIYLTFSGVYQFALDPFNYKQFIKYIKKDSSILEYGSGSAPIITGLIKSKNFKTLKLTAADIKTFTFHYAKYRLSQHEQVKFIDIEPYQLPKLDEKYDVIFLMTVLEHLPDPSHVVKYLTGKLAKNGYFIFDYILSEGKGLDTIESVRQRTKVLEYIRQKYRTIEGKIKYNESMGTTVCQKR